ncbi:aminopeptidase N [Tenacibaculum sp. MAR_2009_124]|uniref:M1 family metallopeptidase n=1 Tax=Tenacibaculum sp. MAR_2009_124 TaxID=1250059 RepID=UPI000897F865|nr:M1 family aminopeptidase [Tenacibaculum sp. MAR_2009_124]SED12793.1 aminopeptidase N [Tenacibaculum sp. MAR_2009_124]
MRNYLLVFCFYIFVISCKKEPEVPKLFITKGISSTLANYRKQQINDVIYDLHFSIPNEKSKSIPSKLKVGFILNDLTNDLVLDFNEKTEHIQKIVVNDKETPVTHKNEHIVIDKTRLKPGVNSVSIDFLAGELSLNRNKEYLYTLLVPDRASTLFPCFDQPNIKAYYNVTVSAPKDWKVLSGGHIKSKINKGDFIEHVFEKTDKMSTYLFSFVAGKFQEAIDKRGSFNMKLLYRETNKEKIKESLDPIFQTHQSSLTFLENYTNYKFPFQKMDFVTLPPFQYGGMEHTGAIQYRENLLFLDKDATITRQLRRAKLIAHETSHMWFGNLVTMKWFDDVWLKEVFANFMADKIMNPVFPEINHDLNFMMSHYPSAYSEDRTKGTNPIKQHLGNLKNAGALYGRIIYNKAPIMMRQLELLLGDVKFQKGIQQYISKFANDNADWTDLVNIFDSLSEKDIKEWSQVWVNTSGRPIISDEVTYEGNKIKKFIIKQQAEDGSHKIWSQLFSIGLVYDNEIKTLNIDLNKKSILVKEAEGLPRPKKIIYNYNGIGYGVFPSNSLDIISLKDDVARGHTYINLYENMLSGVVSVTDALNTYIAGLKNENNELILNYICGRINAIYWTFLSEQSRNNYKDLSNLILQELSKDNPANIQKTLFNLLKNVSHHKNGSQLLYHIWIQKTQIKNLTLNESDLNNLAMKLAIYEHPESQNILEEQLSAITNKDKKERFSWLLPSLSANEKTRDDFMLSLKDAKNREKESWVEAALSNLHHPLRHEASTKHVSLILDLLVEVQLTGDIFFPKRWLANSLGNYSSKEAYEEVQNFIKINEYYNPILLKKLLLVVDNLERAQTIKQ